LVSVDNLDSPVAKRLMSASSEDQNSSDYDEEVPHRRSIFRRDNLRGQVVPAKQKATSLGPAQGADLDFGERLREIDAEFTKIREARERDRAEFELARQIQNERMEELERVLNSRSRSQPEVSVAPSRHGMSNDRAIASNIHDTNASEDDLERDSMAAGDSDHNHASDSIKDEYGSNDGSNIYDG
jgi:hypothetical protein